MSRFCKFNLVGCLGAAVQVMVFHVLVNFSRWSIPNATLLAVEIAVLHNFFWHEQFTWNDQRMIGVRQKMLRLSRFHAGNALISLAGNTLLTYYFAEQLKAPALGSAVAAIAICAPVNFLVANYWVYR